MTRLQGMTRPQCALLLPRLAQEIRDWRRHGYTGYALRAQQEYDQIAQALGFPRYAEENNHDR